VSTLPLDASLPPAPGSLETGEPAEASWSRQQRLAASLAALRRKVAAPPPVERLIAVAGGLLVAAGVVLVLLGWYGAAHTSRVYLQIPYVISGGLLGVVLAIGGASAYLASWLTRLVQDQTRRADEAVAAAQVTAAALVRIEALLAAGATPGAASGATTLAGPTEATRLVATPAGKLAHRPTCPTVAGRSDLRPAEVGAGGLALCRMCEPDGG